MKLCDNRTVEIHVHMFIHGLIMQMYVSIHLAKKAQKTILSKV